MAPLKLAAACFPAAQEPLEDVGAATSEPVLKNERLLVCHARADHESSPNALHLKQNLQLKPS